MSETDFKVGDRVSYGTSTEVVRIARVWTEEFPAQPGVQQQVALLVGGAQDITMRAAHLHLHNPKENP